MLEGSTIYPKIYAQFEDVGPEKAVMFLKHNDKNNRRISRAVVKRYAAIMRSGNWEENGESISISKDGTLLNGQHRLTAIIEANVTVKMLVVYGVGNNVHTFDRGNIRRVSDILQMNGYPPSVYSTSFVGGINFLCCEAINRQPSVDEVMLAIDNFGNICTSIKGLICNGSTKPICKNGGCAAAALVSLYFGTSENVLSRFFECANSGFIDNNVQSSAIVLRNYILEKESNTWTAKRNLYFTALLAIQDFKNGQPRKKSYSLKKTIPVDIAMTETLKEWLNPNSGLRRK